MPPPRKNNLVGWGERGLIRRILPPSSSSYLVPPGDDAAVLKKGRQVLSIDGITENVHFKMNWKTPVPLGRALGWKAMGSALSDLAAMGDVRDRWAMVFLGAPPSTKRSFLLDLKKGLAETARRCRCRIVGGDTVRSKMVTIVVAVGGHLAGRDVLRRRPGQDGDRIAVIGTVGDAQAGFKVLSGWKGPATFVRRFFDVRPLFKEGALLSRFRGVRGGLDLSDSIQESVELLRGSAAIGAHISIDAIPVSDAYNKFIGRNPALAGWGEDYGLMFSYDPKHERELRRKINFTVIGFWTKRHRKILTTFKGKLIKPPSVFHHF